MILTAKHFYWNGMVGITKLKTTNLHHIHPHTNPKRNVKAQPNRRNGLKGHKAHKRERNGKRKRQNRRGKSKHGHRTKVVHLPIPVPDRSHKALYPMAMPWWIYNSLPFLFYVVFESIVALCIDQTNRPTDRPNQRNKVWLRLWQWLLFDTPNTRERKTLGPLPST